MVEVVTVVVALVVAETVGACQVAVVTVEAEMGMAPMVAVGVLLVHRRAQKVEWTEAEVVVMVAGVMVMEEAVVKEARVAVAMAWAISAEVAAHLESLLAPWAAAMEAAQMVAAVVGMETTAVAAARPVHHTGPWEGTTEAAGTEARVMVPASVAAVEG